MGNADSPLTLPTHPLSQDKKLLFTNTFRSAIRPLVTRAGNATANESRGCNNWTLRLDNGAALD